MAHSPLYDVLIVGGGPAGLAAAQAIGTAGSVLVIHKDKEIGLPVRTSGGSWKVHLDQLGVPEGLYHPLSSLSFLGPTGGATVTFGDDRPVILDITATYRYLAALAADAEIRCGVTFVAAERNDDGSYECVLRSRGKDYRVRCRYLVDASGNRRSVLQSLGLGSRPGRIGVGVEHEYEDIAPQRDHATLFVGNTYAPTGYGWIFPTMAGTVRVGIGVTRPESDRHPGRLLDEYMASGLPERMGVRVGKLVETHSGVIPSDTPASRLVFDRVIVVGDSASMALPIVGEGIRYCIEAGRRAGRAIAAALSNPTEENRYLAAYELWWGRTYLLRFQRGYRINRQLCGFSDERWDTSIRRLEMFDGDMMAGFLRMDVPLRLRLRMFTRHPIASSAIVARRIARKFTGAA